METVGSCSLPHGDLEIEYSHPCPLSLKFPEISVVNFQVTVENSPISPVSGENTFCHC